MYPRSNARYDKKTSQTGQTKYKKRIKNVPGQFSSLPTLSFLFNFLSLFLSFFNSPTISSFPAVWQNCIHTPQ